MLQRQVPPDPLFEPVDPAAVEVGLEGVPRARRRHRAQCHDGAVPPGHPLRRPEQKRQFPQRERRFGELPDAAPAPEHRQQPGGADRIERIGPGQVDRARTGGIRLLRRRWRYAAGLVRGPEVERQPDRVLEKPPVETDQVLHRTGIIPFTPLPFPCLGGAGAHGAFSNITLAGTGLEKSWSALEDSNLGHLIRSRPMGSPETPVTPTFVFIGFSRPSII